MRLAKEHDIDPGGSLTRLATEDYVTSHAAPGGHETVYPSIAAIPDASTIADDTVIYVDDASLSGMEKWAIKSLGQWRHLKDGTRNYFGSPPPTYHDAVLQIPNIAFYAPLDDSGSVALDLVGGHNGSYVGGTHQVPGPQTDYGFGTGIVDFLDSSGIPVFNDNISDYTIGMWYNIPNYTNAFQTLLNRGGESNRRIYVGADNTHQRIMNNDNNTYGLGIHAPSPQATGVWHFFAMTSDWLGGTVLRKIFLDGAVVDQDPSPQTVMAWESDRWRVGATTVGSWGWTGSAARFMIVPRVMTDAEISDLWVQGH